MYAFGVGWCEMLARERVEIHHQTRRRKGFAPLRFDVQVVEPAYPDLVCGTIRAMKDVEESGIHFLI